MQIREALKIACNRLSKHSTPSLDARLLLGYAMNMTHEQLLLNYDQDLSKSEEGNFLKLLDRRQSMEPIAYILGKQEFYGLDFMVNEDVLIPRPDTELLIDVMLDEYKQNFSNRGVSILDLGTGSGAISVTLAKEISESEITAIDVSINALDVAKKNAEIHNVSDQINFMQSDWYQNLKDKTYDYIISNPPYIARQEMDEMAEETYMFEPDLALYAKDDGLANYKIIIESASEYLSEDGKLLLEIGYSQRDEIIVILQRHKFEIVSIHCDLAGHPRVIIAKLPI